MSGIIYYLKTKIQCALQKIIRGYSDIDVYQFKETETERICQMLTLYLREQLPLTKPYSQRKYENDIFYTDKETAQILCTLIKMFKECNKQRVGESKYGRLWNTPIEHHNAVRLFEMMDDVDIIVRENREKAYKELSKYINSFAE